MLLTICRWYSLILTVLGMIITIAKDGKSVTEYTGKHKLVTTLLTLPILYFILSSM